MMQYGFLLQNKVRDTTQTHMLIRRSCLHENGGEIYRELSIKIRFRAWVFFFLMLGPERLKHKFSKTLSDLDNCSVVMEEFLIKPKRWRGRL